MNIHNILVIRTHRLGDILQLIPMFQGLKTQYPGSKIFFLTGEEYVPLISGNAGIDTVIPIAEKECRYIFKYKTNQYYRLFNDFYDLILELRKINFDLIINRQYEFGAILAYLIGTPCVYGGSYTPEQGHFIAERFTKELFHLIQTDRRKNRRNLTDWSRLIAGIKEKSPRKIHFPISAYSLEEAKMLTADKFTAGTDLIGVQMGAAKSFRQWGINNFLPVLKWLAEVQGKKLILTGSEDEKEAASLAVKSLPDGCCLDLTGRTSLPALAAVIAQCKLLLTPDTGTMHIASAVGTPVLALFYGSAYPWETGPYGAGHFILWPDVDCAPCLDPLACPYNHRCKMNLTTGIVIKALKSILNSNKTGEIKWSSPNSVKLLMTAVDNAEQCLITVEGKIKLPSAHAGLISSLTINDLSANSLLLYSDEVGKQLLDGQHKKSFETFSNFFSDFSLYMTRKFGKEIPFNWSNLHNKISHAIINGDTVMLHDLLKYTIEPIIKKLDCPLQSGNFGKKEQ